MAANVLIMAGGTGGHVFPALACAREFQARGYAVHWLGTPRGIENELVPAAGLPLHLIQVSGLRGKGLASLIKAPLQLVRSLFQARRIIRELRPVCVLGLGGYVTGPGGLAAKRAGVPLVIHEQNAVAGTANRSLAPFAKRVCEAFPNTFGKTAKLRTTGNPVREELFLETPRDSLAGRLARDGRHDLAEQQLADWQRVFGDGLHLELTRTLAERFNSRYGKTFTVPEGMIVEGAAKIYDLQEPTSKMSKSGANPKGIVNLLDDPKTSAKRIKSAVTDNDGVIAFDKENKPGVSNLLVIQSALTGKPIADIVAGYEGQGYGALKVDTADALEGFTTPLRARYDELMSDRGELEAEDGPEGQPAARVGDEHADGRREVGGLLVQVDLDVVALEGCGAAQLQLLADLRGEALEHVVDAVLDSGDVGLGPTTVVDFTDHEVGIARVGDGDPTPFEE